MILKCMNFTSIGGQPDTPGPGERGNKSFFFRHGNTFMGKLIGKKILNSYLPEFIAR